MLAITTLLESFKRLECRGDAKGNFGELCIPQFADKDDLPQIKFANKENFLCVLKVIKCWLVLLIYCKFFNKQHLRGAVPPRS